MAPLTELPNLEELNLSPSNGITDDGAQFIAQMRSLKTLSLSDTPITNKTLFQIKDLPVLETLALSDCYRITDDGVAHLKDLPKLKKLDLSKTKVTDDVMLHLKDKPDLVINTQMTKVSASLQRSNMEVGAFLRDPVCEDFLVSHREFFFRLFTALIASKQEEKNVVVSPMSVFMALQLVREGTSGENLDVMTKLLKLQWGSIDQVRSASLALKRNIEGVSQSITLLVANSLWFDPSVDVDSDYQALCREFYEADVLPLESKEQVNQWCARRTRGLIPELAVEKMAEALILNAVYFKGLWQDEFDAADTMERDFTAPNKVVRCPFMTKRATLGYFENSSMQAIRLPYKGQRFSFYAIKPRTGDVWKLAQALHGGRWSILSSSMSARPGYLAMPRFKYGNRLELDDSLNALGFAPMYSRPPGIIDKLKRSGMNLAVGTVMQQALIEVNEKGTEAAAITAVVMCSGSIRPDPPKPFEMILDSPFLYIIADDVLKLPVFIGITVNPQEG